MGTEAITAQATDAATTTVQTVDATVVSGGAVITTTALGELAKSPPVAVGLFFMWICGVVLSYLYIDNNDKFTNKPQKYFFNLGVGFLPGAAVMITYHAITYGEMIKTLEGLNQSLLPSSIILAGLSSILLLIKVAK